MERIPSLYFFPAFHAFLLLHSILIVEPRSLEGTGNKVFQVKNNEDIQDRIIAFLLHKNIIPDQDEVTGLEMTRKFIELQELEALREVLDTERQLASSVAKKQNSMTSKRGEPCFWKYCV